LVGGDRLELPTSWLHTREPAANWRWGSGG